MLSNRIPPQQVKEAYDETGIVPERYTYLGTRSNDEKLCACGLGVLTTQKVGADVFNAFRRNNPRGLLGTRSFVAEQLNVSIEYVCGFEHGFDATERMLFENEEYQQGYKDGAEAYKLSTFEEEN